MPLLNHAVDLIFNHVVDKDVPPIDPADERLSRILSALADPSRRRIIELLREAGELRVTEIADAFSMSLNGVSKHLKVLERAHVVSRRVDGREHWFEVNWRELELPYTWLHFYSHFWSRRLDALIEYVQTNRGEDND